MNTQFAQPPDDTACFSQALIDTTVTRSSQRTTQKARSSNRCTSQTDRYSSRTTSLSSLGTTGRRRVHRHLVLDRRPTEKNNVELTLAHATRLKTISAAKVKTENEYEEHPLVTVEPEQQALREDILGRGKSKSQLCTTTGF